MVFFIYINDDLLYFFVLIVGWIVIEMFVGIILVNLFIFVFIMSLILIRMGILGFFIIGGSGSGSKNGFFFKNNFGGIGGGNMKLMGLVSDWIEFGGEL